jgi:homoserine O-acetyltransferase
MGEARQFLDVNGSFEMSGGTIIAPTLAYETWGQLTAKRDNAVLVFTGLSTSSHVASSPSDPSAGWWEEIVGSGKPVDSDRYFVICVNSLGSCFGSTGPASTDPETGDKYRLSFPALTLEDVARSAQLVVEHLGIEKLFAVIGGSMGGMTALAYTLLYPGRSNGLVSISSAAQSVPFAIALRSLQREMVRSDPRWLAGQYEDDAPPVGGMHLARKLGMITYRSSEEWSERFGRTRVKDSNIDSTRSHFGIEFEVESYLDDRARKFAGSFDANCYLYLSRASDLFDASDHGGSVVNALANIGIERALVVGVNSDILFPPHQQQELADSLGAVVTDLRFELLDSIQGHDSFLIDMERFCPVVAKFFEG